MRWAAALSIWLRTTFPHLDSALTGEQFSNNLLFAGGKLWGLYLDFTYVEEPNLRRHLQRREGCLVIALERAFELAKDNAFKLLTERFLSPSRTRTFAVSALRIIVLRLRLFFGRPFGLPDAPGLNRDTIGGRP